MGILSIYVKDDALLAEIKAEAKELERSVSWYLLTCHRRVFEAKLENHSQPEKEVEK